MRCGDAIDEEWESQVGNVSHATPVLNGPKLNSNSVAEYALNMDPLMITGTGHL
jgi:hypothetical protein